MIPTDRVGRRPWFVPPLAVVLTLAAPKAYAQTSVAAPTPPSRPRWLTLEAGAEYYLPTHANRQIQSVFVNATMGGEVLRAIHLHLYAGLTATQAWGSIVQWDQDFRDVRYDTMATGVGPLFAIRARPLSVGPLSLSLDVVGAVVLYNTSFPPGGDVYNFTWRLGGSLAVRVSPRVTVLAGLRWMHVSNGQGLGPQNPSYEAIGFPVEFALTL